MRRVAAAVVAGGCALAGIGFGIGHKAVIVDTSLTGTTAIPITRPVAGSATKTVEFKGYQISVPASWPVYWLNKDPQQCVRYDVNAVYVGTPGANQQCPPGLIGRTQTVSIGGQAGQPAQFTPAQTGQQAMLPPSTAPRISPPRSARSCRTRRSRSSRSRCRPRPLRSRAPTAPTYPRSSRSWPPSSRKSSAPTRRPARARARARARLTERSRRRRSKRPLPEPATRRSGPTPRRPPT